MHVINASLTQSQYLASALLKICQCMHNRVRIKILHHPKV
jgi:hypothetical protein